MPQHVAKTTTTPFTLSGSPQPPPVPRLVCERAWDIREGLEHLWPRHEARVFGGQLAAGLRLPGGEWHSYRELVRRQGRLRAPEPAIILGEAEGADGLFARALARKSSAS